MERIRNYIKSRPNLAMSIPTLLCFVQFIQGVLDIIKTRKFDFNAIISLLSSLDGFETVILCALMIAMKEKSK